MRDLWGNKVTVKGIAYFNPSGSVRFIEAHTIRRFEHGEEIFYSIPDLISPLDVGRKLEIPKTTQNPLKAIWGKWPGEESIEDILVVLKNMSREN